MFEQQLQDMDFSNVDIASLDDKHAYVFRLTDVWKDRPAELRREFCELLCRYLNNCGIKFIIIQNGDLEITELVKE